MKTSTRKLSVGLSLGIALSFGLASSMANASQNEFYIGADVSFGTYSEVGAENLNPTALNLKGGYYITDHFSIQAQLGLGVSDDDTVIEDTGVSLDLKNSYSLFLKADLPVTDSINLYTLLGYSNTELKASSEWFTVKIDESSPSYGIGVEAEVSPGLYIGAEYTALMNEKIYEYSAFNVGLTHRF